MIKRTILILLIGVLGTYLIIVSIYNSDFALKNIIDAGFVIGFSIFSLGLITLSNAGKVFQGISFSFKQMFGRKKYSHMAFYDYKLLREKDREKTTGVPALVVGLLFIIVTSIISYTQF